MIYTLRIQNPETPPPSPRSPTLAPDVPARPLRPASPPSPTSPAAGRPALSGRPSKNLSALRPIRPTSRPVMRPGLPAATTLAATSGCSNGTPTEPSPRTLDGPLPHHPETAIPMMTPPRASTMPPGPNTRTVSSTVRTRKPSARRSDYEFLPAPSESTRLLSSPPHRRPSLNLPVGPTWRVGRPVRLLPASSRCPAPPTQSHRPCPHRASPRRSPVGAPLVGARWPIRPASPSPQQPAFATRHGRPRSIS
jgi:hypothetical protein